MSATVHTEYKPSPEFGVNAQMNVLPQMSKTSRFFACERFLQLAMSKNQGGVSRACRGPIFGL